jgi:integrase
MPEYRLVEHRGKFSLAYNEQGRGRVRVALGTDDRGLAESRARDIWRERTKPETDRVADLWAVYVKDRKATVARTDRFESLWKALEPHFGHRLGSAINADDCRAYHKERKKLGKSNSTIRTELEFLRACLHYRYGKGSTRMWFPPQSSPRDRHLTREELDTLLASIEAPHVRLFAILAITTGARMTAILDLTWDRVAIDAATPTVDFQPAGRHQTNKRRTIVPINKRALEALREAKQAALTDYVIEYDGQPIKSVRKAIRQAATRSKVPCSPHVFRHTAGVWMAQADVPMQKIAQYLGHTSTRVTETVYARYSPSFMADASAALEF